MRCLYDADAAPSFELMFVCATVCSLGEAVLNMSTLVWWERMSLQVMFVGSPFFLPC